MKYIKKLIINSLDKKGFKLLRSNSLDTIAKWHEKASLAPQRTYLPGVTFVIFSKDRPLQLHALLQSFLQHVKHYAAVHVLYNSSNKAFEKCYHELQEELHSDIHFQQETSFAKDLVEILATVYTEKIAFLVDDIVFTGPVDMEEFDAYPDALPSLRLGRNIKACYTAGIKETAQPPIKDLPNGLIEWTWGDGEYDWGYSLSLDGNIFSTKEITSFIAATDFKAPNSLELKLQTFAFLHKYRKGVAYNTSRIVNIPCNRVQTEILNRSGNISVEELMEFWNKGVRIDHHKFNGYLPQSPHEEIPFTFMDKAAL